MRNPLDFNEISQMKFYMPEGMVWSSKGRYRSESGEIKGHPS